jgi:hypothetical protein
LILLNLAWNTREVSIAVEMTTYSVPGWFRYPKKQGLHIFQVPDPANPKNDKAIPFTFMLVFRVAQQPPVEVCREPNIV